MRRPLAFYSSLVVLLLCAYLTGCAGTREAYDAASTPQQKAYVLAEHYSALVKQAADMKDSGALTGDALAKVQAADRRAKPFVIGDPDAVPPKAGIRQLADAYEKVSSAENHIALEAAITHATLAINDFITNLKEARR